MSTGELDTLLSICHHVLDYIEIPTLWHIKLPTLSINPFSPNLPVFLCSDSDPIPPNSTKSRSVTQPSSTYDFVPFAEQQRTRCPRRSRVPQRLASSDSWFLGSKPHQSGYLLDRQRPRRSRSCLLSHRFPECLKSLQYRQEVKR